MAESFEDRLNITLQRKRDMRETAKRRRIDEATLAARRAAERAEFERKLMEGWDIVKAQIDGQIRVINQKSAELELVAATEDRKVDAPGLALRIVQFSRRPGKGRFNLLLQLSRSGMVQYSLDGKSIYSGKSSQMIAADHDLIVANVLDFIIAGVSISVKRNQYAQSWRARSWRETID